MENQDDGKMLFATDLLVCFQYWLCFYEVWSWKYTELLCDVKFDTVTSVSIFILKNSY